MPASLHLEKEEALCALLWFPMHANLYLCKLFYPGGHWSQDIKEERLDSVHPYNKLICISQLILGLGFVQNMQVMPSITGPLHIQPQHQEFIG